MPLPDAAVIAPAGADLAQLGAVGGHHLQVLDAGRSSPASAAAAAFTSSSIRPVVTCSI